MYGSPEMRVFLAYLRTTRKPKGLEYSQPAAQIIVKEAGKGAIGQVI